MCEVSHDLSCSASVIMIVLTGDLDMLPAIKSSLKRTLACIEIWSWQKSLSSSILKFSQVNERVSVHYLDLHIEKFTYVNFDFNLDANADLIEKVKFRGIVLTFDPETEWRSQESLRLSDLQDLSKWPFKIYHFSRQHQDNVLVYFPSVSMKEFDLPKFMQTPHKDISFVKSIQKYEEFRTLRIEAPIEENWD